MPFMHRGEVSVYYETRGRGFPLLLFPPGGMNATIDWWQRAPFNPVEVFSPNYWTITLDQRNAGRSTGPLDMEDPWGSYASDHLELMNHLGIERCLVLGQCIGCSFALSLIQRAPHRVVAAVLKQPVGIDDANREVLPENLWRRWAADYVGKRSENDAPSAAAFGTRMCSGDFVLSVSREFVQNCSTPLLVMPGNNLDHPRAIGMEVAKLAPNAELIEEWREPTDLLPPAVARIRRFFAAHTPTDGKTES
jgi:pimeloyl-ACP methyl ester carboxylesterase